MNPEHIEFGVSDQIATLALNRPDTLNAIDLQMLDEMLRALGGG